MRPSESELLLGIDLGTSSTKAVLTTPDGVIVATASRRHGVSSPRPGWAEVDAEDVWWGDVVALCREIVPQLEGRALAGMCVSGAGPCLLVCDAEAHPVRPAILYGIDTRASQEIGELTTQLGAEKIFERAGKALSSQAVGPKMRWLARHEPEVWGRARRWYNSNSFIAARLTGAYVIDHHSASQSDPLYDLRGSRWAGDWVPEVADHLEMPDLVWPSQIVGTVQAAAAAETGLPEGTPVAAGTVDAWSEAFSAGVRRPGDLMLMYGTTMFFVQVLRDFHAHPMLWTTAGVEPNQFTLAAGMSSSGSLTTWVQDLVGGAPFGDLVREAAEVTPGSDGLLMLPYFAGERTPVFDPLARGTVVGLTLKHRRGHLFRAVYESIAYGIRQIVEFLDSPQTPVERLVAVGGGTQGGLWTKIVSDVTQRPQQIPEETIGASYGDALLAAIGTGLVAPQTDWARVGTTVEPDLGTFGRYDELYGRYGELYPATRDLQHAMARIQIEAAGPPGR